MIVTMQESAFACTPELRALLTATVMAGKRSVVEFGAGSSSVAISRALSSVGGGRLVSLEQDPAWCRDAWSEVSAQPGVSATLVPMTVRSRWGRPATISATLPPERFDLCVIDAPQYFHGRDSTLYFVARYLEPGATIILDDAGRKGEQWALCAWLASFPGLELVRHDPTFGWRGVAVLTMHDNRPRASIRSWIVRTKAAIYRARNYGKPGESPTIV